MSTMLKDSEVLTSLKLRYFELAYKYQRCHVGSGYTVLPIINEIYAKKATKDLFVLSCGHASLALYVVLEKYLGVDPEECLNLYRVHPNRDTIRGIYCSTGSLGHGLGVAAGMAIGNPNINIHCLISDGECSEGSIFETLRIIKELNIKNIIVYVNLNGFSAYNILNTSYYEKILSAFLPKEQLKIYKTNYDDISFLNGIDAHYYRVTEKNIEEIHETFIH